MFVMLSWKNTHHTQNAPPCIILELVPSNIWGPSLTCSTDGYLYHIYLLVNNQDLLGSI